MLYILHGRKKKAKFYFWSLFFGQIPLQTSNTVNLRRWSWLNAEWNESRGEGMHRFNPSLWFRVTHWGIGVCVCFSLLLDPNRTQRTEERCDKSILLWLCFCQNAAEGMRSLFVPSFKHVDWLWLVLLPQFSSPHCLFLPTGLES